MIYEVFYTARLWFFIVRRKPTWQQQRFGEQGEGVAIGWRKREFEAVEAAEQFIRGSQ